VSKPREIRLRRLTRDELGRVGEIDRTERIDVLYLQHGTRLEERRGDFSARAWLTEGRGEHSVAAQQKALERYVPAAYHYLLSYPDGKPPGTRELMRWSHFKGHGVPTIVLTHILQIPDGDAWIVVQRHFYVSTGYNSEQALAAFLPAKDGGTVVLYANRTSTDQVTGFGGGAKRSIGSKLLASQLEEIFESARKAVK